jgi:two-component system, sensor histidine kinase and response regulator
MTAGAGQEDLDRCLAAGMDDCVPKPVKGRDLLAVAGRWVGQAAPPVDVGSG